MKSGTASDLSLVRHQSPSLAMLKYFSHLPDTKLVEMTVATGDSEKSVMQASLGDLVGTGRGESRYISTVKAVAEFLERKFFDEFIAEHKNSIPFYKRNTNGFAVHFDPVAAHAFAIREAFERHILQLTYFRHGWDGFYLTNQTTQNGLRLTKVVAKYHANGYAAGLVLAQADTFPGLALGYFCDKAENLQTSDRWIQAESEAIDKIEPLLKMARLDQLNPQNNIDREMFKWFFEPFQMPSFSASLAIENLPDIEFQVELFDLKTRWNLDFPFYAARCDGQKLLPLLIPREDQVALDLHLTQIFEYYQLKPEFPTRNPIL